MIGRGRAFIPPPPAPVDEEGLRVVERLAAELAVLVAPFHLGVRTGETPGCSAHRKATEIERSRGFSTRSRALQQIASAYAAIQRARESAEGTRSAETLPFRLGRAREELAEARRVIEAMTLPVAAE